MKTLTAVVVDPVGLHARPATVAVSAAGKFKCNVTVAHNGKSGNMKSIMAVMALGIPTKAEIVITCDGEDEDAAIEAIEATLRAQNVIA